MPFRLASSAVSRIADEVCSFCEPTQARGEARVALSPLYLTCVAGAPAPGAGCLNALLHFAHCSLYRLGYSVAPSKFYGGSSHAVVYNVDIFYP